VDRGVLRYPAYCVSRQRPVFASRAALLQYEEALALAGRVEAALEVRGAAGSVECNTSPAISMRFDYAGHPLYAVYLHVSCRCLLLAAAAAAAGCYRRVTTPSPGSCCSLH
jgi:hypothetical protein